MENGTLHELLNTISSLHQWECTLNFPDLRCPEGFVNLCCIQVPGNSNFPAGCYYCFDDKLYGEGLNSAKKLVNDIYQSARKSGFTLIIGSSDSNRIGDLWMKRIRLVCKRAKVYEGSKLAELNNQKESTGLMALSDISNTDDTTKKKRRKTLTQRATCADEKCPFQITLYLHKYHNKWYIKSSSDTPALHLGHRKLLPNEIATSSKMLLAADIDTLKMHSSIHLSSTQSAMLLNQMDDNLVLLPSQKEYDRPIRITMYHKGHWSRCKICLNKPLVWYRNGQAPYSKSRIYSSGKF